MSHPTTPGQANNTRVPMVPHRQLLDISQSGFNFFFNKQVRFDCMADVVVWIHPAVQADWCVSFIVEHGGTIKNLFHHIPDPPKAKYWFYLVPLSSKMDLPGNHPMSKTMFAKSHPNVPQVTLTFIDNFMDNRSVLPSDDPIYRPLKYNLPIKDFPFVWPMGPASPNIAVYRYWCEAARSSDWVFNLERRYMEEHEPACGQIDVIVLTPYPGCPAPDFSLYEWIKVQRGRSSIVQDIIDIVDIRPNVRIVSFEWLLNSMDHGRPWHYKGFEISVSRIRDIIVELGMSPNKRAFVQPSPPSKSSDYYRHQFQPDLFGPNDAGQGNKGEGDHQTPTQAPRSGNVASASLSTQVKATPLTLTQGHDVAPTDPKTPTKDKVVPSITIDEHQAELKVNPDPTGTAQGLGSNVGGSQSSPTPTHLSASGQNRPKLSNLQASIASLTEGLRASDFTDSDLEGANSGQDSNKVENISEFYVEISMLSMKDQEMFSVALKDTTNVDVEFSSGTRYFPGLTGNLPTCHVSARTSDELLMALNRLFYAKTSVNGTIYIRLPSDLVKVAFPDDVSRNKVASIMDVGPDVHELGKWESWEYPWPALIVFGINCTDQWAKPVSYFLKCVRGRWAKVDKDGNVAF